MATQQTEALSFVARLPAPSPALTERLEKWGAKECDRFSIQPQGEEVTVFITRKNPTTALKLQRNIRTMASHWQVPLPLLGKGWLVPRSAEEHVAPEAEKAQHHLPQVASSCAQACTLSEDFDTRANALLEKLLTAH